MMIDLPFVGVRCLLQLLFVVEIQNCRDACLMGGGNMQSV
jgi:hypothetical protein